MCIEFYELKKYKSSKTFTEVIEFDNLNCAQKK